MHKLFIFGNLRHVGRYILGAAIVSSMLGCAGPQPNQSGSTQSPSTNILSGFQLLSAPRSDIAIGAEWIENVGPQGAGLDQDKLFVVSSLTAADFNTNSQFEAGLAAKLAAKIGFNTGGGSAVRRVFRFERAEIVRVRDIAALRMGDDVQYVWEGIRLQNFSVVDSNASGARAALTLALPAASVNISGETGGGTSNEVTVSGAGLYVAYRVIKLAAMPPYNVADVTFHPTQRVSSGHLGSEYDVEFRRLNPGETMSSASDSAEWGEPRVADETCSLGMTVISFNELDASNLPKRRQWKVLCRDSRGFPVEMDRYSLGARKISTGLALDDLLISHFDAVPLDSGEVTMWGRFQIERREFHILPVENASAPGY